MANVTASRTIEERRKIVKFGLLGVGALAAIGLSVTAVIALQGSLGAAALVGDTILAFVTIIIGAVWLKIRTLRAEQRQAH